jgi:hypothetical protein
VRRATSTLTVSAVPATDRENIFPHQVITEQSPTTAAKRRVTALIIRA